MLIMIILISIREVGLNVIKNGIVVREGASALLKFLLNLVFIARAILLLFLLLVLVLIRWKDEWCLKRT